MLVVAHPRTYLCFLKDFSIRPSLLLTRNSPTTPQMSRLSHSQPLYVYVALLKTTSVNQNSIYLFRFWWPQIPATAIFSFMIISILFSKSFCIYVAVYGSLETSEVTPSPFPWVSSDSSCSPANHPWLVMLKTSSQATSHPWFNMFRSGSQIRKSLMTHGDPDFTGELRVLITFYGRSTPCLLPTGWYLQVFQHIESKLMAQVIPYC